MVEGEQGVEQRQRAKEFLLRKGINVSDLWLNTCVAFLAEQLGATAGYEAICCEVFNQWLLSDLLEVGASSVLPDLALSGQRTVLRGSFHLQVKSVLDIGSSLLSQYDKLAGSENANDAVNANRDDGPPPWEPKPKRMLWMEVTDGVHSLHAMEYRPIPVPITAILPGTKIRVFGEVECGRRILMLTERNMEILGGLVSDLAPINCLLPLLSRLLNKTNNIASGSLAPNQVQNPAPPPAPPAPAPPSAVRSVLRETQTNQLPNRPTNEPSVAVFPAPAPSTIRALVPPIRSQIPPPPRSQVVRNDQRLVDVGRMGEDDFEMEIDGDDQAENLGGFMASTQFPGDQPLPPFRPPLEETQAMVAPTQSPVRTPAVVERRSTATSPMQSEDQEHGWQGWRRRFRTPPSALLAESESRSTTASPHPEPLTRQSSLTPVFEHQSVMRPRTSFEANSWSGSSNTNSSNASPFNVRAEKDAFQSGVDGFSSRSCAVVPVPPFHAATPVPLASFDQAEFGLMSTPTPSPRSEESSSSSRPYLADVVRGLRHSVSSIERIVNGVVITVTQGLSSNRGQFWSLSFLLNDGTAVVECKMDDLLLCSHLGFTAAEAKDVKLNGDRNRAKAGNSAVKRLTALLQHLHLEFRIQFHPPVDKRPHLVRSIKLIGT